MRVLLLTGEHPEVPGRTGGIGSIVADAASALSKSGHEVHVLVSAPGLATRDTTVEGTHLHVRGLAPPFRLARGRAPRLLAQALSIRWHAGRLGRFDVVEGPEWQGLCAGFAVGRTPLVVSLQTPAAVIAAHDDRLPPPTPAVDRLERALVRRADRVLSASALLVRELRSTGWLPPDLPVQVAAPAVDLARWASAPPPSAARPVVLGIGRLEPRKGFASLIDAVATLEGPAERRVELLGGDTSDAAGRRYSDVLRRRADRRHVELHLHHEVPRSDLPAHLAAARVVVLPSTFDSFNMAGLEALATGRGVVVTDRVGLAELDDGSGALSVVPSGDLDALARAISYGLDPIVADQAGAAARALAGRFGGPAFADQRTSCYRELVARR